MGAAVSSPPILPALPALPILGVDPGQQGAFGLYHPGLAPKVWDLPGDPRQQFLLLSSILRTYPGLLMALEQVHGRPRQAGVFGFGVGVGVTLGCAAALGIPVRQVPPQVWKPAMGLLHADKTASRALAAQLFPALASSFVRVKDDGRAEALLLAVYAFSHPEKEPHHA